MPTRTRKARRGRKALPRAQRKVRLIQTRVPEGLDEALREEARKKRLTVSQLIRNVLEDTFHLVDNIVAETASLTETVKRDAIRLAASAKGRPAEPRPSIGARRSSTALDAVVAWQRVVLGREARCALCRRTLPRGKRGLLGLQEDPAAPKVWLCLPCRTRL